MPYVIVLFPLPFSFARVIFRLSYRILYCVNGAEIKDATTNGRKIIISVLTKLIQLLS